MKKILNFILCLCFALTANVFSTNLTHAEDKDIVVDGTIITVPPFTPDNGE